MDFLVSGNGNGVLVRMGKEVGRDWLVPVTSSRPISVAATLYVKWTPAQT